MKLFAYGTLLAGMRLHEMLADAHYLGPAIIRGKLLDLGDYAGLVEGDAVVTGEIYEIDHTLLERLDQVEGFRPDDPAGSLYLRKDVRARRFADGTTVDVAAYFYSPRHGARSIRSRAGTSAGTRLRRTAGRCG